MAIPLDPSTPAGLGSPGEGDDEIRALKQWLVDVLGVPITPTAVATAGLLFSSGGLVKALFKDGAADPQAVGELVRFGTKLKYFDTDVRVVLNDDHKRLKFKTATEGYATAGVLHNDDTLFFAVSASTRYAFEVRAWYQPQASAQAMTLTMTGPTGSTVLWNVLGFFDSGNPNFASMPVSGASGTTRTALSSTSILPLQIDGHISVGATPGNIQFQWTGDIGQTMNVLAGSYIKLEKVP